jgi:hypothetical protein
MTTRATTIPPAKQYMTQILHVADTALDDPEISPTQARSLFWEVVLEMRRRIKKIDLRKRKAE